MPSCAYIQVQPNGLKEKAAKSTQKWDTVSKRMVKILIPQVVEVVPEPPEPVETFVIETLISGTAQLGSLRATVGLFIDKDDNIFATSFITNVVVRFDARTGDETRVAGNGTAGFSGDGGPAIEAQMNNPADVMMDSIGNMFIVDSNNNRIRRVDAVTGIITTVAGNGTAGFSGDGGGATGASLDNPRGVAVDSIGNIFFTDTYNNRIRRVDGGTRIITTVAGNGVYGFSGDGGAARNATFRYPTGLSIDSSDNLFVCDWRNQRIRRVDVGTGVITTVAGNGGYGFSGDGGPGTSASLRYPQGVTVDAEGNLLIADTSHQRVRLVDAVTGIITTIAGNGADSFSGDGGPATDAALYNPRKAAVDSIGNIFFSELSGAGVPSRIRRVNVGTGIITTFRQAGGTFGGIRYRDFNVTLPCGVTVSGSNLYVVNTNNQIIYVFDKQFGIFKTSYGVYNIAGNDVDAGLVRFNLPFRVAVDSVGNIYVADFNNDRIRRINFPVGNTTTIAGGGQDINTTSGIATTKRLTRPNGVAVYGDIVYFTNTNVNNVCKVVNGQISTLPGVYSSPEGLTVDSLGNLYVANPGFNKITRVTPTDIVSDVALPSGTTLNYPRSVAIDTTGNIYIADSGNNRILRLNINNTVTVLATDLNTPMDVSVDTDGTVYVADYTSNRILKIYSTYV